MKLRPARQVVVKGSIGQLIQMLKLRDLADNVSRQSLALKGRPNADRMVIALKSIQFSGSLKINGVRKAKTDPISWDDQQGKFFKNRLKRLGNL